jgi:glycosyltransferase involved in cell wall biosynthesis
MRIGISTRGINQGSFAISEMIQQITGNLLELGNQHEFFLYANHPESMMQFSNRANVRVKKQNNRLIFDQIWLPRALKKDKIDLALFFKGTIPLLGSVKTAVVMLDLGYYYPELNAYKFLETRYMKTMMRLSAAKARTIFSISQYTKDDIVRIFKVNPQKVHVSPLAVPDYYSANIESKKVNEIKFKYQLPDKFIFFPTSLSPRKNLIRTISALMRVSEQIPHALCITGGQKWKSKEIEKLINQIPERIIKLDEVPTEEMPLLFSLADFLIYPSLYEGFGVPILEAFNCGCPVLTSDTTSMPEVAGDAALLVDSFSVDSIADGILELATNSVLKETLKTKGYKRAELFSYRKTASIILKAIENKL